MRTGAIVIILSLLVIAPLGTAQAKNLQAGQIVSDPLNTDKKKDNACDCCQKCKAAKSTVESQEDTQDDDEDMEKNGCEDCCTRCGKPLDSTPEAPPEIINKTAPPDIIEKKKETPN